MPHVVVAEGLIGVVVGKVDDRGVIAVAQAPQLFVVGAPGRVRDPTLVIPAAVDRHAEQERPGTELVQLAQEKLQVDPFLVSFECSKKRFTPTECFVAGPFPGEVCASHFSLSSPNSLLVE